MMRVRIGRRDNHSEYEPMEELKIGRSLNKVLEKIMDIERFFIRTGISLPIGGSLLLVARKGWKEGE
jgi:hypothetical protein